MNWVPKKIGCYLGPEPKQVQWAKKNGRVFRSAKDV